MKMAKALALVLALVLVVVCFNSPVFGEDPWEENLGTNNGNTTEIGNPGAGPDAPDTVISILLVPDKSATTGINDDGNDDGEFYNSNFIVDVQLFLLFRILPVQDFQVMFFKGAEFID